MRYVLQPPTEDLYLPGAFLLTHYLTYTDNLLQMRKKLGNI